MNKHEENPDKKVLEEFKEWGKDKFLPPPTGKLPQPTPPPVTRERLAKALFDVHTATAREQGWECGEWDEATHVMRGDCFRMADRAIEMMGGKP